MNKVILMGRLTRDPEVRYGGSSEPVAIAKYTLAVNRQFKKDGQQDADFINCRALGKRGEFAEKYFKKGQMVAVCGRIEVSNYEDKSGQKRVWTEVFVEDQYFAESRQSFETRMGSGAGNTSQQKTAEDFGYQPDPEGFMPIEDRVEDEELPF